MSLRTCTITTLPSLVRLSLLLATNLRSPSTTASNAVASHTWCTYSILNRHPCLQRRHFPIKTRYSSIIRHCISNTKLVQYHTKSYSTPPSVTKRDNFNADFASSGYYKTMGPCIYIYFPQRGWKVCPALFFIRAVGVGNSCCAATSGAAYSYTSCIYTPK